MAVLLDTGILYASYDRDDSWHERALLLLSEEAGGLIAPAPILPEVDYLLGKRLGPKAQESLYDGLTSGDLLVVDLQRDGYRRVLELNREYAALRLGFVDAAVVAIAEQIGLSRLATTDRRHFGPLAARLALDLLP